MRMYRTSIYTYWEFMKNDKLNKCQYDIEKNDVLLEKRFTHSASDNLFLESDVLNKNLASRALRYSWQQNPGEDY